MRDVEIRKSARGSLVEEKLVEQAVRKRVIGFRGGKRIDALAPGVGRVELNAVADALGDVHLHGIVKRVRLPERRVDAAKIRIDLGLGTARLRPGLKARLRRHRPGRRVRRATNSPPR